jgi:signal peptidase II
VRRRLPFLGVLAGIVALDQATKWWVRRSLELHEIRPLVEGLLSLSHIRNRGAAFGILQDADLPHQSLIFSVVSLLALAAIAYYAFRLPAEARLPRLALSLVLGGAIGNLIDRIRFGYVVDFVHVYWKSHQWPDFNAADSAITVGVTLLLLDMLRTPEGEGASKAGMAGTPTPAGRID